jgi:putative ABC transport system permease protein
MLGISWGIISVVVLLSYGDGFRGALDAGFRGAFSDGTVVTFLGQTSLQAGGERAGKRVRVTADDVMAIGELPLVKNVSPEFMQEFPVVYGNKQSSHLVRGVAASYGTMRAEKPQAGGRFLEDDDAAAPPGRVHRLRGAAQAVCGRAAGRRNDPRRRPNVRGRRRDGRRSSSNYNRRTNRVFIPWTTMGGLSDNRYVGTFVWQAVSRCSSRRRSGRCGVPAKRYRYNPADERALNMFGSRRPTRSPTASSAG